MIVLVVEHMHNKGQVLFDPCTKSPPSPYPMVSSCVGAPMVLEHQTIRLSIAGVTSHHTSFSGSDYFKTRMRTALEK